MSLIEAIRKKYSHPSYAVFEEVPETTGFDARRRCDAIAFGIWPSKGFDLVGFEIKASRADWQRELTDPAKAEAFLPYCDRFWLVATPKVAVESEIPVSWGWLELRGNGLHVRKDAPKLTSKESPRALWASMLRSVEKTMIPKSMLEKEREAIKKEISSKKETGLLQTEIEYLKRSVEQWEKSVKLFEEKSGIRIDRYGGEHSAAAGRALMNLEATKMRLENLQCAVDRSEQDVKSLNEKLRDMLRELKGTGE